MNIEEALRYLRESRHGWGYAQAQDSRERHERLSGIALDTLTSALERVSDRETLGRVVRDAWVEWAKEQPNPKPSWLVPWSELNETDKEADRRIGEAVARHVIGHYDEDDEPLIDPNPGTFFDGNDWSGFGGDDNEASRDWPTCDQCDAPMIAFSWDNRPVCQAHYDDVLRDE